MQSRDLFKFFTLIFLLSSCNPIVKESTVTGEFYPGYSGNIGTATSLDVTNDTFTIQGVNLTNVSSIGIQGGGISRSLNILTKTGNQITAEANAATQFVFDTAYQLILSNAQAATASFPVTFTATAPFSVPGIIESTAGGFKFPDGTTQVTASGGASCFGGTCAGNTIYSGTATFNNTVALKGASGNIGLNVDASGNVGIGTAAPGGLLQATDSSTGSMTFANDPAGGGGSPQITLATGASSGATAGAYMTMRGKLEAWTQLYAANNTAGQRFMRYGHGQPTNTFSVQLLNDAGSAITSTPFSIVNNAPTNSFYLNSAGNVGIGTTSPNEKLQVAGGARVGSAPAANTTVSGAHTSAVTTITVASTTTYPSSGTLLIGTEAITYTGTTATTFTGCTRAALGTTAAAYVGGETVSNYLFIAQNTSTTPKVVVTSSGNVGIGTTSPGSALDVNGDINIRGFSPSTTSSKYITFAGAGTYGSGYIYLGADNKLHLAGYANTVTIDSSLEASGINGSVGFRYGDLTLNYNAGISTYIRSAGQDLRLQAASTYNLLLNASNGNVGIGTISPNEKLEVTGGARVGSAPAANTTVSGAHTSAVTTINVVSTTTYPTAGTLLIGTEAITYTGTTATTFTGCTRAALGTTAAAYVGGETVSSYLFIAQNTSTTPKLVVMSSGNVGIGTTSPGARLDVGGQIRSSSSGYVIVRPGDGATMAALSAPDSSTLYVGGGNQNTVILRAHTTNVLTANTSGNVGIGTGAGASRLTLSGDLQFTTVGNSIKFADGTSLSTGVFASAVNALSNINSEYDGPLSKSLGTGKFLMENSGKVGIGTSLPSFGLEVTPSSQVRAGQTALFQDKTANTGKTTVLIKAGDGQTNKDPLLNILNLEDEVLFSVTPIATTFRSRMLDTENKVNLSTKGLGLAQHGEINFSAMDVSTGFSDVTIKRGGKHLIKITDGKDASGSLAVDTLLTHGPASLGLTLRDYQGKLTGFFEQKSGTWITPGGLKIKNQKTAFNSTGIEFEKENTFRWVGNDDVDLELARETEGTLAVLDKNQSYGTIKAGNFTVASDRNLKDDIAPLEYGLEEILALNPVSYVYKGTHQKRIGLIAQEVEKVIPEIVLGKNGRKGISYDLITSVLIKAVQEVWKLFELHNQEIKKLKKENHQQQKLHEERMAILEDENRALKAWACKQQPEAAFCR